MTFVPRVQGGYVVTDSSSAPGSAPIFRTLFHRGDAGLGSVRPS